MKKEGKFVVKSIKEHPTADGYIIIEIKFNRYGRKLINKIAKEAGKTPEELLYEALEMFVENAKSK